MNRVNPWFIVLILIGALLVFGNLRGFGSGNEVRYSDFINQVNQGNVDDVVIGERTATVTLKSPQQIFTLGPVGSKKNITHFEVTLPSGVGTVDASLIPLLNQKQVSYNNTLPSPWLNIFFSLLPLLVFVFLFWFIFMRAQGGQNQVMQFGQSRAKRYGKENKVATLFPDVAGHEEAKRELIEVVDFLKHPQKYQQIGAEIPKGVLLVGPPGTGKTLLARAIAGEADCPFYSVSASEFMEMFVGVGASRVRTLFEDARKNAPAIIFIDEIDSIGRKRGAGIGGGHDEREQTLNQILSEMDGFDKQSSVIVLAATNRPDILDPALLRPGRFDRQVTIDLPNLKEREAIIRVHSRNKPIAPTVDLEEVAKSTPYFSGADLKNIVNEAALEAARIGKTVIDMSDFYRALDKITLGLENGSLTVSDDERRAIAYHEAGHAVTAAVLPGTDKLQKVSIIPRGRALGAAFYLPEENVLMSKERLENRLVVTMGGRAAEEAMVGSITSGAADDFKRASQLAKRMVLEWGMGDNFRHMALADVSGPIFLGEDIAQRKDFSERTAQLVDEDVKGILDRAYERSKAIILQYGQAMHEVAEALLQNELITGDVVREAVARAQASLKGQDLNMRQV
ncbi:MAG: ATP-dependent zinc metalloprotease FtsH [Deinococcaceae bacterium]